MYSTACCTAEVLYTLNDIPKTSLDMSRTTRYVLAISVCEFSVMNLSIIIYKTLIRHHQKQE